MDRGSLSEEGRGRGRGRVNEDHRRGLSASDNSNRVHTQTSRREAQNEAPELVRTSDLGILAHQFDATVASQQTGFQMSQMYPTHRRISSVPVVQPYQFSPYPTGAIGYVQPQEPLPPFQYVPAYSTNRQVSYQPCYPLPLMQQDQAVYHPLHQNQYAHVQHLETEPVVTPSPPTTTPQQSHDPPMKPKQSGNALWVGNIPASATIVDLKDHFSRDATSTIESVKLIARTRCAFVNYATHDACVAALEKFHDSHFHGTAFVCRMRKQLRADGSETSVGQAEPKQTEDMARDEEAAKRDKTRLTAEKRYFIMKSLSISELEDAKRKQTWATQEHNVDRLNEAYETAKTVYLLFSANKSGGYFGLARMASSITPMEAQVDENTNIINNAAPLSSASRSEPSSNFVTESDAAKFTNTPATEFAPKGRIYEDPARQIVFWEATGGSRGEPSSPTITAIKEQGPSVKPEKAPEEPATSTSRPEKGRSISKPRIQNDEAIAQTPAQEPPSPSAQARPSITSRSESLPNPATRHSPSSDLNAPVIVTSSSSSLHLLRRPSGQDTLSSTSKSKSISISTSTSTKSRTTNTTNSSSLSSSSRSSFKHGKIATASPKQTATSEDHSGEAHHVKPTTTTTTTNTTTFHIEWLSTRKLPFSRLRGLRNAWNGNREVKVARDGTEVETEVGEKVANLFFVP